MADSWSEGDDARKAVPIILGAGLLALFTLPNISETIEDWNGDTHTASIGFSEIRFASQFVGGEWVIWVALLGVAASIFAALFFRTDGTQPRRNVMGVGALLGLFYPAGFLLVGGVDLVAGFLGGFFSLLSWGVWLYWLACILAAIIGFGSTEGAATTASQSSAPAYLSAPSASPTSSSATSSSGQPVQTIVHAEIRTLPNNTALMLTEAPTGSTLTLHERVEWSPRPLWIKVSYGPSGTVGYVKGTSIKSA